VIPEDERQAILYIHWLNTSFIEAARRVAQLGADLDIRAELPTYSWPCTPVSA
jgi:esterase/lipase superfamily enzyme